MSRKDLEEHSVNIQDNPPTITILFVDENEEILHIGKTFLEMSGPVSVETAQSGTKAMEMLRCRQYNGVLSDYTMSPMNGIMLLWNIRSEFGDIPFILFTHEATDDIFTRAFDCGADFCITKEGNLKDRFLVLEKMFTILIERSRVRNRLKDLREQEMVFRSHSGMMGDCFHILMNTPAGCLGRTVNGEQFFYSKKKSDGETPASFGDFIIRHSCELRRIQNRLFYLERRRHKLAERER